MSEYGRSPFLPRALYYSSGALYLSEYEGTTEWGSRMGPYVLKSKLNMYGKSPLFLNVIYIRDQEKLCTRSRRPVVNSGAAHGVKLQPAILARPLQHVRLLNEPSHSSRAVVSMAGFSATWSRISCSRLRSSRSSAISSGFVSLSRRNCSTSFCRSATTLCWTSPECSTP